MLGLMQSQPLLISSLIEFAERHHGDAEIVSRRVEGDIHRYTYRDLAARARRLANALDAQQLQFSDRVATLAWNGYRHMEMYFGVSGSGRVLHTINPRLHPDQIAWIAAEYVTYAAMAEEFGLAASRGSDFHSPDESHTDLGTLPYLPGHLTPIWETLADRVRPAT